MLADPLVRICLDHLNAHERRALEHDLQLAAQVQKGLLPPCETARNGWQLCYHYQAANLVSGDYCDIVDAGDQGIYFMVGDVSGKGVAASMLMAHLHAMFRTLIGMGLSLKCILEHAARVFSESTLPSQYATLVCGRALPDGSVEIANAGHPAPLLLHHGTVWAHEDAGLPLGLFQKEEFDVAKLNFEPGQKMLVYSDGVSEAINESGQEYGARRLRNLLSNTNGATPLRFSTPAATTCTVSAVRRPQLTTSLCSS
ncbi:MAG: serine/threonine-protein phosphatase [Acidobacteriaceae bacterium]|nr:serine/threonine-protein phosphatase [Acidobacteriaceae bacterium]